MPAAFGNIYFKPSLVPSAWRGGKVVAGTARLADERKLRCKVGVSGCSRQAPAVVATWSPPSDPTSTPATPPEFVPPEQQPGMPRVPPEFMPPEVAPATPPTPAETPGRPVRPIEVPDPEKDPMRDPDRRRELEQQPLEQPEAPERE